MAPTSRHRAGTSWIPSGIRQAASLCPTPVPSGLHWNVVPPMTSGFHQHLTQSIVMTFVDGIQDVQLVPYPIQ